VRRKEEEVRLEDAENEAARRQAAEEDEALREDEEAQRKAAEKAMQPYLRTTAKNVGSSTVTSFYLVDKLTQTLPILSHW
jgi:hypothetical protein